MKKRYKLLSLTLACITCLFAVFGCTDNTGESDTQAEEVRSLADYTIIFGENKDNGNESAYADKLQAEINKKYGIKLEMDTDFLPKGEEYDSESKQILVGHTDYPQSKSAESRVTRRDWLITFDGNKIVLMGSSDSLESCVDYFLENYLAFENDVLSLSSTEEHLEEFTYAHEETNARIVSLNLRYAHSPVQNNQSVREPRIIKFVTDSAPDSFGVQECEAFWKKQLDASLVPLGYTAAQQETYKGSDYAFKNFIWYNTKTVKLVEGGSFWLSETPDTPSKGYGSNFYISAGWAILENKTTGAQYVHINAHLDSEKADIRAKEVVVLLNKIKEFEDKGYKVFVTGDFNDNMMSDTYTTMTKSLTDARDTAKTSTQLYTYNNYQNETTVREPKDYTCLDYCFYKKDVDVYIKKFNVVDKYGGGYMSDHNALIVDVTLYKR